MANKPTTHPAVGSSTVRPANAHGPEDHGEHEPLIHPRARDHRASVRHFRALSFVEFPLAWRAGLFYDALSCPRQSAASPTARRRVHRGIISVVAHGTFADFTSASRTCSWSLAYPARRSASRSSPWRHTCLVLGIVFAVIMAVLGNLVVTPAWLGVPLDAVRP
ncbi:MAG: hypothetical protein ACLTEX_03210 [Eggerthella lenta]